MEVVFDIVVPLFGLMLVGYGVAHTRLLGPEGIQGVSNFVFYCAIPALLFRSVAGGALPARIEFGIVYAYFLGCLIVFGMTMFAGRILFGAPLARQALMGITVTFGNVVLLGIPLVYVAFGDRGVLPVTLISSFHAVILLTLATVLVEIGLGARGNFGRAVLSTLGALIRNPIIVAIVAGFAWRATGLALPVAATTFLKLLAGAAAPCALFALGATLTTFSLKGDLRDITLLAAGKLLVLPLVVWLVVTYVIPLGPTDAAVAMLLAALPTGVNPFILARKYDLYTRRAASAVLVTTAISVVTLGLLLVRLAPAP
ncbi:MAG: AEC family transporter [Rhodospirillales bacterium]|nr:AEC family transporter [Rhodospirillales bacterium]